MVELIIGPHPKLTKEQKYVVMMEHGGEETYTLKVRASRAEYVIQNQHVSKIPCEGDPKVHPLYLVNFDEIKSWLF